MAQPYNLSLAGSALEVWERIVSAIRIAGFSRYAVDAQVLADLRTFTDLLSRRLEAKAVAYDRRCSVLTIRWTYAQSARDRRAMDVAAAEGKQLRDRAAGLRKISAKLVSELAAAEAKVAAAQAPAKPARKPRKSRAKKEVAQPAA